MAFLLTTVIWLAFTRIRQKEVENPVRVSFKSSFGLLAHRDVLLMVLGIFLYVGAEVSVSSGLPIYLQDTYGFDIARLGLLGTLFFFIALMSGRFLGALILNWISPRLFLRLSILLSVLGFVGLVTGNQTLAMVSIFLIGLGFANIFPLIFSITVEKMPERINELSGLMVTAIVGGAIVPLIMGLMADATSTKWALLVPFVCALYIVALAFSRKTAIPSAQ
jgi:fucose permease